MQTDNTVTGASIKAECELQYKKIKEAEQRIDELRAICTHEKITIGNYSWRSGCICPATFCSDCGKLITCDELFLVTPI